eukprot:CAMPEP_0196573372 /NCGR_PEP_ID=MMETSP1081-20130531/3272_1 /TAXON_ID=36882 /ORGANISM="Pyramimonas amylifera, Strain CCMP720" /LENGTH=767 /DNA_ID=CAMNT_0041891047 /DNA_START=162 /DNA_END=2465 /DNA_ORIENTATION=-
MKTIVSSQPNHRVTHAFSSRNNSNSMGLGRALRPSIPSRHRSRDMRIYAGSQFPSSPSKEAGEGEPPPPVKAKESPLSAIVRRITNAKPQSEMQISYAQMLEYLQNKRVVRLAIFDDGKEAIVEVCVPGYEDEPDELMERQTFNCLLPGDYHEECLKLAKEANSKNAGPEKGTVVCNFEYVDPATVAPPIVGQMSNQVLPIIGFWIFQQSLEFIQWLRRGREAKKSKRRKLAESLGASLAVEYKEGEDDDEKTLGVRFDDVAGVDHAVTMFQEIIDIMLGDPRYAGIGATLPKGVLLEGPPGTGKTLLAKAVASEGGVPFFSANGSEFVEMYVGVAAARVRDLFAKARANTPAIIFIDEIDTIGRARGGESHFGADSSEREQGLMQLLVEMDGFQTKDEQVLVIGATNLRSTLDPALLRAGRFDRIVRLGLPNEANRLKILEVHARGKLIPSDGDSEFSEQALLRRTAQLTVGYSGAELANLLNEAAIIAVRRGEDQVGMPELEVAMEKMKMGLPRPPLPLSAEKRKLAYVEAGRAVLLCITPEAPNVLQVSVAPRGGKTSRVTTVPMDREKVGDVKSFQDYLAMLSVTLAGRATEEVVFGRMGVTLLTSNELSTATEIAVRLVSQSGIHPDFQQLLLDEDELNTYTGARSKVDKAVSEAVYQAYAEAMRLVQTNRPAIDQLVEELLEKDTIYGSRIREIVTNAPTVDLTEIKIPSSVTPTFPFPSEGKVRFSGNGKTGIVSFHGKSTRNKTHLERNERVAKTTILR